MNFLLLSTVFDISTVAIAFIIVVTLGCLVGFVWLIQQLGAIKGFIRDVAGVTDENTTSISGQPITVQMHTKCVNQESYHVHCRINREEHARIEARMSAIELRRETDKADIIHSGEERADGINSRINVLIEKVGQLTGKMEEVAKRVQ